MNESIKKPNWQHWKENGIVTISEAIYLSLDLEPDESCNQLAPDRDGLKTLLPPGGEEERRHVVIMIAAKRGLLPSVKHYLPGVDPRMPKFELAVFGAWATEIGWRLPEEFPKSAHKVMGNAEKPLNEATSFNTAIERMPRWKYWQDIEIVSTQEAADLSFNLEPWSPLMNHRVSLEEYYFSLPIELYEAIVERAMQVATLSSIMDENNFFKKIEGKRPDLPDWKGNFVRLVDFGQGALKKGWTLPKGFPVPDDSTSTLSQGKTNSKRSGTFDSYQKIANEIYKNCKPGEKLPRSVQKEVALAIDEFHGKTIEETNAGGSPTARGIAASLKKDWLAQNSKPKKSVT